MSGQLGTANLTKILVIDDEAMMRRAITRILERAGYSVVSAADGIEGLASFRRETPGLVITDLIMPEREGFETIRQILHERPGTKIIAISGGGRIGSADFLVMARELGACDILRKPFEPQDLVARVAACLETGDPCHRILGATGPN